MYCSQCGAENPDDARFCEQCGAPLDPEERRLVARETGFFGQQDAAVAYGAFWTWWDTVSLAVGWLYWAGMHSSSYQATVGKMLMGMKVTDLEGQRISFARATGRYFAEILSGLLLMIGYIMVAFTRRKQGLHDMIAGTLVVRVP